MNIKGIRSITHAAVFSIACGVLMLYMSSAVDSASDSLIVMINKKSGQEMLSMILALFGVYVLGFGLLLYGYVRRVHRDLEEAKCGTEE